MKFNLVFPTVVAFTLLSGATCLNLATQPNPTEQQKSVFSTTTTTWNVGIGAIFGLLGGKNLPSDRDDDPETDE